MKNDTSKMYHLLGNACENMKEIAWDLADLHDDNCVQIDEPDEHKSLKRLIEYAELVLETAKEKLNTK